MDNETNKSLTVIEEPKIELDIDFIKARDTIKFTMDKAMKALDDMTDIANASQHPAAYDVLSTMLKNTSQLAKDMMEIYKRKAEISNNTSNDNNFQTEGNIVNNNVFVGSTSELLSLIKDSKNNK